MRADEWINLVFFATFAALAGLRPLELRRRQRAVALGICGIGVVVVGDLLARLPAPTAFSLVRDWAPAPLLLVAYWQAGQLAGKPSGMVQSVLASLDPLRSDENSAAAASSRVRAWLGGYFELAYLTCYALVPLAYGFCAFREAGRCAEEFWRAVLPPTYFCYALVPFLPHLPPRMRTGGRSADVSASRVREWNLWLLRRASIGFNTFPSAHVASSLAASLTLWHRQPAVGIWFLVASCSIAVGVVVRRYHYVQDSVAAAALAVVAYLFNTYVLG